MDCSQQLPLRSTLTMSYAPAGESSSDLWLERSYFVGGLLAAVAYGTSFPFLLSVITTDERHINCNSLFTVGFHCSIFGTCVYLLFNHPSRGRRPPNYKLLAYVAVIWIIATVHLSTRIKWYEMIWIDNRNIPGGPIGVLFNKFSLPINTVGNASFVINNCLTDLMVVSTNYHSLELKVLTSNSRI